MGKGVTMRLFSGLIWGLLGAALPSVAAAEKRVAQVDGIAVTTVTVATGFEFPVFLTAPPGDARLFVVEKAGQIRLVDKGILRPAPFLDISGQISTDSERGLLGLAFHPGFAANGLFYIDYTDDQGDIRIAAVQANAARTKADLASLRPLLTIPHHTASNHNGGWIGFGPDGFLYIAVGDGGGAGDRPGNAQNPDVLLGKLLRIDVDATPYGIPPGNPFAKGGGAPEIFALGLRNPWRNSFDGSLLYIGDVGQGNWEEVNVLTSADAGANLGWNRMEGLGCFEGRPCDQAGLVTPIHRYDHDSACSITGGYVYRGAALPALDGRYFYADFCKAELSSLRFQDGTVTGAVEFGHDLGIGGQITSFGTDSVGEVYILATDGTVSKLVPAGE